MKRFEVGKTYATRSVCDSDLIISARIVKRTAKTVTTADGKQFRLGTWYDGSTEFFRPWGNYSMCPMMTAEKEVK